MNLIDILTTEEWFDWKLDKDIPCKSKSESYRLIKQGGVYYAYINDLSKSWREWERIYKLPNKIFFKLRIGHTPKNLRFYQSYREAHITK